jgi:multicomponent Na+:H+ antiporter subunit B
VKTPSPIVRYIARRTVPLIQLYALYVLGHGEDGPGGGFQGGVIFASSFVLIVLTFGYAHGQRESRPALLDVFAPMGAMVYAGVGVLCLLAGGAFLEYGAFVGPDADHHAQHMAHHFGLMGIELGVMLTVTTSMVTLFLEMARPDHAAERAEDHAEPLGDAAAEDAAEGETPAGPEGGAHG